LNTENFLKEGYSKGMACMTYMSMSVVNLTFGEVYVAPKRAPRSQPGLWPESKKDLNHRGHSSAFGRKQKKFEPQRKLRAQRKERAKQWR